MTRHSAYRRAAITLIASSLLLSLVSTHAQDAGRWPAPATQPADAIRSLTAALTGRWKTREKYERFEPWGAAELTAHGEMVWRPGPGGLTLLEEYQTRTPIGDLIGFGIFWWDQQRQLQHLFCANVDPAGCALFPPPPLPSPSWNGKELVLDNEVTIAGKTYAWREVTTFTSATTFTQTIDIGETRSRLTRWMSSEARKVRGSN